MNKKKVRALDQANAEVLVEIAISDNVSEANRMRVYEQLLSSKKGQSFFKTMFEEILSYGSCPHCNHKNHWLIPEEDKAQMGWVSHKKDERVLRNTNKESCPEFQEACSKKMITV